MSISAKHGSTVIIADVKGKYDFTKLVSMTNLDEKSYRNSKQLHAAFLTANSADVQSDFRKP